MRTLLALLVMGLTAGPRVCLGQEPDWWKTEQEVTALLLVSNIPISQLVRTVTPPAAGGTGAMFKVSVLLRAGMNEQAIGALRELKEAAPRLDSYQAQSIYYHAFDHEPAWDVAQAVLEVFADNVNDVSLENRLLKHWQESGRTVEQIDEWLAARAEGGNSLWVKERLRFAERHGRAEALVQQLSDAVRRNPTDMKDALMFLDALLHAQREPGETGLSWFPEVVRPARSLDARALAGRLQRLENLDSALAYYQQAIQGPLSEEEVRELGRMRSVMVPPDRLRAEFAADALEAMSECLLKLGRNNAAQEKMVEAADVRERHGLARNAVFAGRAQAATGGRTIEGRIAAAEAGSGNDPAYWRERAQYYRGRQEHDLEEEALKKGLSMTVPQLPAERPERGADLRSSFINDYARFLAGRGREDEAVALLREEVAKAPASSLSALRAVWVLRLDFRKHIRAGDAVFWDWLSNRPEWGHHEEGLLFSMLQNAPKEALDAHFTRAETLAGHPSRAFAVGWILNRMEFPKRSLPLLQRAVETATDDDLKQKAAFALLESLLDTGDWKAAETIFPEASRRLTAQEIPQWHSRLALAAARDGAKDDALRLWIRTANASPTRLDGLAELAGLGLQDDLAAFYKGLQKELPQSAAPARALKLVLASGPVQK